MRRPTSVRVIFAILTLAAVPVLDGAAFTPVAAASVSRATVFPNSGLTDGQRVIVRWSGFAAMRAAGIFICEKDAVDKSRCANTSVTEDRLSDVVSTFAVTGADGTGSEALTVALTDAEHGLAGHPDIQCTPTQSCDIVVSPSPSSLTGGVHVPITFAEPGNCPEDAGLLHFTGSGADAPEAALGAWTGRLCNSPTNVSMGYASKDDVQGRLDYQCSRVDFAGVERLPDWQSDMESCPAVGKGHPARRLAPLTLSATVIAFNMADQKYSYLPRLDHLVLSPDLLAEIFTGKLTNGRDPRIIKLNPGVQLPANLKAIARADQSAINFRLTQFLAAYAPKAYKAGGVVFAPGPTDSLAAVAGLDLKTGAGSLAKAMMSPDNDPRQTSYGYLGLMDSSAAAKSGVATVTIRVGTGAAARDLNPTNDAILRAVAGVKPDRYGYFNLPAVPADPKAWPMSVISYAVAPSFDANPAQLASAAIALGYILDAKQGQRADVLPTGYVPLPAAVIEAGRKAITDLTPDALTPKAPVAPVNKPSDAPSTSVPSGSATPIATPTTGAQGSNNSGVIQTNLASVFDQPSAGGSTQWLWFVIGAIALTSAITALRTRTKGHS